METKQAEDKPKSKSQIKREYNWIKVLVYIHFHLFAVYAVYLIFTRALFLTTCFGLILTLVASLGATAGAHRLWAHNSYKASGKLRFMLMLAQTFIGQGTIYYWVRKHRLHHKYLGTEKDPYDISRGFLYTHFFSNIEKPTKADEELLNEIDMSDIEADGIVMFQKKYYGVLLFFISVLLPLNAPCEYWGETIFNSVFIIGILAHTLATHASWLINSAILVWGLKPNDKYPADTNLVFLLTKSYWPQYHYLTPWDYQTGEYGNYAAGCTTTFIRIWAAMGLATDLQTIDSKSVKEALGHSLDTGLPIQECLRTAAQSNQESFADHYLQDKNI